MNVKLALLTLNVVGKNYGAAHHVDFCFNENVDNGPFQYIKIFDAQGKAIELDGATFQRLCAQIIRRAHGARVEGSPSLNDIVRAKMTPTARKAAQRLGAAADRRLAAEAKATAKK